MVGHEITFFFIKKRHAIISIWKLSATGNLLSKYIWILSTNISVYIEEKMTFLLFSQKVENNVLGVSWQILPLNSFRSVLVLATCSNAASPLCQHDWGFPHGEARCRLQKNIGQGR